MALRATGSTVIAKRYVVLSSGTLIGTANLMFAGTAVPFFHKGAIVAAALNEIAVNVVLKARTESGLNATAIGAFDTTGQMLPNYALGVFERVTLASGTAAGQFR